MLCSNYLSLEPGSRELHGGISGHAYNPGWQIFPILTNAFFLVRGPLTAGSSCCIFPEQQPPQSSASIQTNTHIIKFSNIAMHTNNTYKSTYIQQKAQGLYFIGDSCIDSCVKPALVLTQSMYIRTTDSYNRQTGSDRDRDRDRQPRLFLGHCLSPCLAVVCQSCPVR